MELNAQIEEIDLIKNDLSKIHLAVEETTDELHKILLAYASVNGAKEIFEESLQRFQQIEVISKSFDEQNYLPFHASVENTKNEIIQLIG